MTRAAIFAAFRAVKPDVFAEPAHITILDGICDDFGIARDEAPSGKKCNAAGRQIIKDAEGLRLQAYLCPAGIPTIGFGHTGPDVQMGQAITMQQAEALLDKDIADFEAAVSRLCPVTTDNQFSALVSFAFNVGEEALKTSTLRRKLNEGDYGGAQVQFARWNKGGGRILSGLVKRRAREAELYGGAT